MAATIQHPTPKLEAVKGEIKHLKLEDTADLDDGASQLVNDTVSENEGRRTVGSNPSTHASHSPIKIDPTSPCLIKSEYEVGGSPDVIGGEITVKLEPGKPPKLSRAASQKVVPKAPELFGHYEDKTEEATRSFEVISSCIYSSKYIGYTDLSMDCECIEEWGKHYMHFRSF